jgi:hypothetical protein
VSQTAPPSTPMAVAGQLGNTFITSLPAQFLALVGLNVIFMAAVLWFIAHEVDQRLAIFGRILQACGAAK